MYMYISYIYRERVMYVFPSEFNPYQDHYDVVAVSTLLTVASNSGLITFLLGCLCTMIQKYSRIRDLNKSLFEQQLLSIG